MEDESSLATLLEHARLALASFDCNQLEVLAEQAGRMSAALRLLAINTLSGHKARRDIVPDDLTRQHRLLRQAIELTRRNLDVVRRLRGQDQEERMQWAR